jgi:hypothetical protein
MKPPIKGWSFSVVIHRCGWVRAVVSGTLLVLAVPLSLSQVSPSEIINPQLRAVEKTYLKKLVGLSGAVAAIKFPFSFSLSRYAGLDPKDQLATDKRGLEFVRFHDRTILKLTGNYNAAFNADQLTANQRSGRVFNEVILSILQLLPGYFAPNESFDAFGFEVSYHTRRGSSSYAYEGKEILVVVLDRADLFRFVNSQSDADRQEVLNRSEIYLNGKDFGLALGQHDPFDLEALDRPRRGQTPATPGRATLTVSGEPGPPPPNTQPAQVLQPPVMQVSESPGRVETTAVANTTVSPAALERLQAKYQTQLDQLTKEGLTQHHFVQYAPPSFGIFRNQIFLQISLRNPARFEKETTSIYKRAAQSFDLFLAPQLKSILSKVPDSAEFEGLEITILNELISKSSSSEAIEFICPIRLLRQFASAEMTNQELINQSIVLVNEVRIALNLQLVE